jgi:hypothetical protein
MRTVWRVAISLFESGETTRQFVLPKGAEVVAVKAEKLPNDVITIWLTVDDEAPLVNRYFKLLITGQEIPEGATYHGTVVTYNAYQQRVVLHLLELLA